MVRGLSFIFYFFLFFALLLCIAQSDVGNNNCVCVCAHSNSSQSLDANRWRGRGIWVSEQRQQHQQLSQNPTAGTSRLVDQLMNYSWLFYTKNLLLRLVTCLHTYLADMGDERWEIATLRSSSLAGFYFSVIFIGFFWLIWKRWRIPLVVCPVFPVIARVPPFHNRKLRGRHIGE